MTAHSCSVQHRPVFLSGLTELEFSLQIFKKFSNTKFHENPLSGSPVIPYRQTDGRTWRS